MPIELMVVLLIGFFNVCMGYAFALYVWPGGLRPAGTGRSDVSRNVARSDSGSKTEAPDGSAPKRPFTRLARPRRVPGRGSAAVGAERSAGTVAVERGSPSSRSTDTARPPSRPPSPPSQLVLDKTRHLRSRLQRLTQQIRQLRQAPDKDGARALRDRLDRVTRGAVEDLRYAQALSGGADAGDRFDVDGLERGFRSIVDPLMHLPLDGDDLSASIERLVEASSRLEAAVGNASIAPTVPE